MSTSKRASSFYKITIVGPYDLTHGFLSGLVLGSGNESQLFYCLEEDISGPSVAEKLMEKINLHSNECHFVVDNKTRALLKKNNKKMFAETGLQILDDKKIKRAKFAYKFHAYAKPYGDEIRSTLKALPKGVKKSNTVLKEINRPGAKGIEAYAPAHHYEITGGGDLSGRIDLIIDARDNLDQLPLLETTWIELELV